MTNIAHIHPRDKPRTALCGATLQGITFPLDTPVCGICVQKLIAITTRQARPQGYLRPMRPVYETALAS